MLNTAILDIVIALAFTYFILALMVSSINEGISNVLNLRGKMLKKSLFNLFYKSNDAKETETADKEAKKAPDDMWQQSLVKILDTPFIDALRRKSDKFPAYIPSKSFLLAMMQFLKEQTNNQDESNFLSQLKEKLTKNEIPIIKGKFRVKLLTFIGKAQGDIEKFKNEIEEFYINTTDQLRDWYKRKVKMLIFIYGLLIALVFNVDTLYMGKVLWQNPTQVAQFLEIIQKYDKAKTNTKTDSTIQQIVQTTVKDMSNHYDALKPMPIGWDKTKLKNATAGFMPLMSKVFGWLITALALSLGAPFWYELFNKILNVRKAIAPASRTSNAKPTPPPATSPSSTPKKE